MTNPTPAPTLEFNENVDATIRRQRDWLEIGFREDASSTAGTFLRVPLLAELQGYQPQTNSQRLPLYVDGEGRLRTLVAMMNEGGNIQFSTASNTANATFTRLLRAASRGETVLYRAHYESMALTIQGEGKLQDRGIQGDATAIPQWGFTLEAMSADYVDSEGTVINR